MTQAEQLELTGTQPNPAGQIPAGAETPEQSETEVDETTEQQGAADATQNEAETDEQKNERAQREAAAKAEKRSRGIQKRMNELTADKYAERKRAEELAEQNRRLLAMLETKKSEPQTTDAQGEPKIEAFTDYNDYVRALARYEAAQHAAKVLEQTSKKSAEEQAVQARQRDQQTVAAKYAERAKEAAKSIPDYEETMEEASEVSVPQPVLEMIARMEDGPVVAYHMVKNRALAEQFNKQPPYMHGILLGQISASLKSPAAVSKAPPPGKTVQSKPGSSNEPPTDPDAYMAWAAKHMR